MVSDSEGTWMLVPARRRSHDRARPRPVPLRSRPLLRECQPVRRRNSRCYRPVPPPSAGSSSTPKPSPTSTTVPRASLRAEKSSHKCRRHLRLRSGVLEHARRLRRHHLTEAIGPTLDLQRLDASTGSQAVEDRHRPTDRQSISTSIAAHPESKCRSTRYSRRSRSAARDISLQMPDRPLLFRDHRVHQVADRNHPHHTTCLHHRKMPDVILP